jgi:hypothetical protein
LAAEVSPSVDEFRDAFHKGLGRAIRWVRANPAPYVDVVVDACLHDRAYDAQIEDRTTTYVAEAVDAAGIFDRVADGLRLALETTTDRHDWAVVLTLAAWAAKRGRDDLHRALYDAFLRDPAGERWGGHDLVALDGVPALSWLAETTRGCVEPWQARGWIEDAAAETHPSIVEGEIARAATSSGAVRHLLRNAAAGRAQRQAVRSGRSARPTTYRDAKELVLGGGLARRVFGLRRTEATHSDVAEASRDLLETEHPELLRVLRRFFLDGGFEGDAAALLARVRRATGFAFDVACHVASTLDDPRVRALGVELLSSRPPTREIVALLGRDPRAGDADLVLAALARVDPRGPRERAHDLAIGLRHASSTSPREWIPHLEWAYEHTPCSFCRRDVVDRLAKPGLLSSAIAEECLLDVNEETREIARRYALISRTGP